MRQTTHRKISSTKLLAGAVNVVPQIKMLVCKGPKQKHSVVGGGEAQAFLKIDGAGIRSR